MTKENITPLMRQYREIKGQHSDCLVFFRLGDFYELFGEDAEIASKELGLVLTKRIDAPMCGVPHHAYESYLTKLINNGHKVAICEQLETPEEARKRGYKATIKRGVTRIVSRGTLIESPLIDEKRSNFLMSISKVKSNFGIAYTDISVGTFRTQAIEPYDLLTSIVRVNPSEIICQDSILSDPFVLENIQKYKSIIHTVPSPKFMKDSAGKRLANFYGVKFVESLGNLPDECVEASSLVVEYAAKAHSGSKLILEFPMLIKNHEYMHVDHFTRKSLELNKSLNGDKKSSLLYTMDKTVTSQGARLLSDWLSNPLADIEKIQGRLDFVEFFVNNQEFLQTVRDIMDNMPDIDRAISRISMKKGGPRDLDTIKVALKKINRLNLEITKVKELSSLDMYFEGCERLINELESALKDKDLPHSPTDGGFVKEGYDAELDEYRDLIQNGEQFIATIQTKYVKETGILNLKIKHNGVLGYFIETTTNNVSRIPYTFIHRQTLASCIRYTTEELGNVANKLYTSEGNAKRQEMIIFENLCQKIDYWYDSIRKASKKVAFIDCVSSLAKLAIDNKYVKPTIVEESIIDIREGRHPVVESHLLKDGEKFTKNDCLIENASIISIVTGPNMGGKSTYLRQNASMVIMAQMGSFVPAKKATIGVVDKIFSRVGASDDISSGKSTFMIEMIETSVILRQATEKSFVILDEIGRGTSTYDGLAIAWAVVEEIHNSIKARTLFATHYHELKQISDCMANVQFLTVCVDESDGKISFMHKLKTGFADKSYGIHVAFLAGFPEKVVYRAEELLKKMGK
ncbi:MAG: DNA mismatch repair protein MutS [Holosporales bacterium]|jgi:DNA mismatch repair protein MutS|nr:DNA mismatch repair protein MutS [Holosporales bacterium]